MGVVTKLQTEVQVQDCSHEEAVLQTVLTDSADCLESSLWA